MNNNINWITPKRGSTGPRSATYAFYLANQQGGKNGTKERCVQGSIRISAETMKKLRWIGGDRVLIGSDDSHVYIKRVQTGGYALSPIGGNKRKGDMTAAVVKTSRIVFATETYINAGDFAVLDDGTVMLEAKAEAA